MTKKPSTRPDIEPREAAASGACDADGGIGGPSDDPDRELVAVYNQLRRAAQVLLADERTGVSVQATTLVHEAYMSLRKHSGRWTNDRHYFNTAVLAMRRILIDRARSRAAAKHGGGVQHVDLDSVDLSRVDIPVLRDVRLDDVELLEAAFSEFEEVMPDSAEIAQLRWIANLSIEQVAEVVGSSPSKVKASWRFGRAWLLDRISQSA